MSGGYTIQLPTSKKYQTLFPGYKPTTTVYGPDGIPEETSFGTDPSLFPSSTGAGSSVTSGPAGILPGDSGFVPLTTQDVNGQTDQQQLQQGLPPRDATTGNATDPVVPQSGGSSSSSSGGKSKLNWIEEIGIRLALVIVGIVLIGVGIHVAGARNAVNNPRQLLR